MTLEQKRMRIEADHPDLTVARQCRLLGLSRSSWYFEPTTRAYASVDDSRLMKLIDRQYTATPFYGVRKMTAWLHTQGEPVNVKRVRRLLRTMGLQTIYARPGTSVKCPES